MLVPYNGSTALIQVIVPDTPDELLVHVCSVVESAPTAQSSLHPEVSIILQEFAMVFHPLTALPPERACDHVIPLILGAKPVHIRPYRYTPALKDEIEKQVAEMLTKGVIQPSSSAFSSPMLLVKKKDGT